MEMLMARGIVMTDKELKLTREALMAKVRLDLSRGDVSYQPSSDVKTLGDYKVNTVEAKRVAAKVAREELNSSIVSVGGDMVAFVKRRDSDL